MLISLIFSVTLNNKEQIEIFNRFLSLTVKINLLQIIIINIIIIIEN